MSHITPLDRLFVHVFQNGSLYSFGDISGVSSFSDIVNYVRGRAPHLRGMTTLSVRSTTGGWSASRPVFFMPC